MDFCFTGRDGGTSFQMSYSSPLHSLFSVVLDQFPGSKFHRTLVLNLQKVLKISPTLCLQVSHFVFNGEASSAYEWASEQYQSSEKSFSSLCLLDIWPSDNNKVIIIILL